MVNTIYKSKYADELQSNLYKKFPSTHYLSNPKTVDHVMQWSTLFKRNLHKFALDYYGFNLHFYQTVVLYFMGICNLLVIIACRAAAKSFIVSMYAVCYCGTHPYGQVVLTSKTKQQAKLMVTQKIKNELMGRSVALKNEISNIRINQAEVVVEFHNHAMITVIIANDNGRGARSNVAVREEFRQISENIEDSVIKPFQVIRQAPYMNEEPYKNMEELKERPVDIYISSSWLDNGHWMWKVVDSAKDGMFEGNNAFLFAFDLSIPLAFNIKTREQLIDEKKTIDSLTWRIEFKNERVKENESAYFTYKMLMDNKVLKKPFYPLMTNQIKKKSYNVLARQEGEIRIVSCDMAFVAKKGNDNSVFSCIRALPEIKTSTKNGRNIETHKGYRRQVSYMEHRPGGDLLKQALRIRQLYEDFDADYIVLDTRNNGLGVFEYLNRAMYDEERDVEYKPLTCMNNEEMATRIQVEGAEPVIFAVNASEKLNSKIATNFRKVLVEHQIEFLVDLSIAKDEILPRYKKENLEDDVSTEVYLENPFLETQLLITETAELVYEKKPQTDRIVVHEQGAKTKDRYTSVSYGSYFIYLMEQDILFNEDEDDLYKYKPCASCVTF